MKKAISELFNRVFTPKDGNVFKAGASITLGLATAAANIGGPLFLLSSINALIKNKVITQDVWLNILYYTLIYSAGRVIPVANQALLDYLNANISSQITQELHAKCFELPHNEHLTQPTGQLAQLIVKNYTTVEKILPSIFGEIVPTTAEVITATTLLSVKYDYRVGLILLGTLALYISATAIGKKNIDKTEKELFEISFATYNRIMGTLDRYEIAHQFDNVEFEKMKAIQSIDSLRAKFKQKYKKSAILNFSQSLISSLSFIGGHMLSLWALSNNLITIEEFLMVSIYLTQFITPLNKFGSSISQLNSALIDFKPIVEFLSQPSAIEDKQDATPFQLTKHSPSIRFHNVYFRYKPEDPDVIKNLNFEIASGSKVAIVGPTGAGKTTIVRLLQRFCAPSSGTVSFDHYHIDDLTAKSLRSILTVVSQKTLLENSTVQENIQYGDLTATLDELDTASEAASIADKANRAHFLQRACGEDGGLLSGGQKQRVAIARSILKGGSLFVLDEATSALDSKTEAEIVETLDTITAGCTTLVITHRLGTIINADCIHYLLDGSIAESGTFEQLMANKKYFYEQMQKYCQDLGISVDQIQPKARSRKMNKLSLWQQQKALNKLNNSEGKVRFEFFEADDSTIRPRPISAELQPVNEHTSLLFKPNSNIL